MSCLEEVLLINGDVDHSQSNVIERAPLVSGGATSPQTGHVSV